MESKSSLKEFLYQLEERLLKPEVRTSPEEITKLLVEDFLNSEVQVMSGIKKIVLEVKDLA